VTVTLRFTAIQIRRGFFVVAVYENEYAIWQKD
jgi:hypothetical protein